MGLRNAFWKERDELIYIYIFVYNVVNFVNGACNPSGVGDSSAARNLSCARSARPKHRKRRRFNGRQVMEKQSKNKRNTLLIVCVMVFAMLFVIFGLLRNRIFQSSIVRSVSDKIDFIVNTKQLKIPDDALAFSVYDMDANTYLFYEGAGQEPTVASLSKLFAIDYALSKVKLDDVFEANDETLKLVPAGSSMANLTRGTYTAKQIMQAMLVPSGNDAAYVMAYNIGKMDLGAGHSAKEYINHFVKSLRTYLAREGYGKTDLYDPSGFSMQATTNLDDINRVTLKLLDYDFVKECMGESSFTITTKQGNFTWKNTNEFLDKESLFYNSHIKGVKTGTMASSYNIIALYENNGRRYLITCLAAHSNKDRYQAVQAAINTVIEKR